MVAHQPRFARHPALGRKVSDEAFQRGYLPSFVLFQCALPKTHPRATAVLADEFDTRNIDGRSDLHCRTEGSPSLKIIQ